MHKIPFSEIQKQYDLELDKVVSTIKKQNSKCVLLQLPDGLKPYATELAEIIQKKLPKVQILVWFGSCFGACDLPLQAENAGVDLIIQFGHSAWEYKDKKIKVV